MDFNQDKAKVAKDMAEIKFKQKDIKGALQFAKKAWRLSPDLDGIGNRVGAYQIHLTANTKLANGDMDWYGLLCISESADSETINKKFKALSLTVHPDKNNSAAAEGAFKLICEARNFLTNTIKREAYDKRRKQNQKNSRSQSPPLSPPPPPPPAVTEIVWNGEMFSTRAIVESKWIFFAYSLMLQSFEGDPIRNRFLSKLKFLIPGDATEVQIKEYRRCARRFNFQLQVNGL